MSDVNEVSSPACEVPLTELLARVPSDARYIYTETDGLKATHFIPVGRYCNEAASRLAEAEQEIRRLNDVVRVKEGNADAARQNAAGWKQYAERAEQRAAEAERRVKELEGTLWKYGDHFPECPVIQECGRAVKPPCNCGYDATLPSPRHQSAEGAEGEGT